MNPLFEKADALTGEVVEAAVTVQKHFGDYRIGKRGILRVILKGADAHDIPF